VPVRLAMRAFKRELISEGRRWYPAERHVAGAERNSQGVTATTMFWKVNNDPSQATARKVYVPGSLKVAEYTHLPSLGGSGITYGKDHAEFAQARESIHALNGSGVKVTFEALPR
jgi:hypothetical protein